MTVVDTVQDLHALTLTIVAEFDAPPERVWQLWSDPRQLERWWGPPTYPAAFEQHDAVVGGRSRYAMTGPGGEKARGWWQFVALDEPRRLEFDEGFADEAGEPDASMPTSRMTVDLAEVAGGTRMTVVTRFDSAEHMDKLVAMGMVDGMTSAMGQMDALLTLV